MPKGVTTSGSPTEELDEELDDVGGQADESQPESSTGNDETNSDSSTEDANRQGDVDKAKPTPLDELRGALTKKAEADDPPAEDDDSSEKLDESDDEVKDTDQRKSKAAKDDDSEAEVPEGDEPESPFKGFSPDEKNALGRKAQQRIIGLNREKKALSEKWKQNEEFIKAGNFIEDFRAKHGLSEDEVVSSLVLSAAYKAGDERALEALEAHADELRTHLKKPPRASSSAISPFAGTLPEEFSDMVSVLGMPEEKVRYLYALEKARTDPPKEEVKAPVQREKQPDLTGFRQASPQNVTIAGFRREDTAMADDAVADFLASKGVKSDVGSLQAMLKNLRPYMEKYAPVNPQTGKPDSRFIEPERRVKAVQIAHQRFVIDQAKKIAEQKRRAGPTNTGHTPTVNNGSPAAKKNPLAELRKNIVGR